jgi:hypothetical protein
MSEEAKRQEALAAEARRQGIPEWAAEMTRAVPDSLVRDIVGDNRGSSSVATPAVPAVKGTGWYEPKPIGPRPAYETELVDRIVERFAGGPNNIR